MSNDLRRICCFWVLADNEPAQDSIVFS
uniref:Uncharacterized protein n=1 Tax=Arundo donax TaxID=35708 RepID=A0A0A8YPN8_ARUDO